MTQQVDLIFRYRIKDGEQDRFEQYLDKVVGVTEAEEPYVLEYHIYMQADGTVLQHERYADEDAIYRHLHVTAEGQADWAAATELLDIMVVGRLSQAFWDAYDSPVVSRYRRFREIARPFPASEPAGT
ncbi:antibiotic biosynthesis monooxygenase [Actinoplanes sp. M2I2]|uniref:antibiotic biosynthesis monooxygenase n=1 Tax=Actinoplanes sp. M2I2 TaxID=1734444 RepID=UPI0020212235|nr:antibiotic biosynthesis monooxygenase [Actinoplanes sp. M2I2]